MVSGKEQRVDPGSGGSVSVGRVSERSKSRNVKTRRIKMSVGSGRYGRAGGWVGE